VRPRNEVAPWARPGRAGSATEGRSRDRPESRPLSRTAHEPRSPTPPAEGASPRRACHDTPRSGGSFFGLRPRCPAAITEPTSVAERCRSHRTGRFRRHPGHRVSTCLDTASSLGCGGCSTWPSPRVLLVPRRPLLGSPWCTRPARFCDTDHVIAHADGGATCDCNLAPLRRRHHRLKTHAGWSYTTLEPGLWLWTEPHGQRFLVDRTGTRDITPRPSGCRHGPRAEQHVPG
jgi:hypothetical protein